MGGPVFIVLLLVGIGVGFGFGYGTGYGVVIENITKTIQVPIQLLSNTVVVTITWQPPAQGECKTIKTLIGSFDNSTENFNVLTNNLTLLSRFT